MVVIRQIKFCQVKISYHSCLMEGRIQGTSNCKRVLDIVQSQEHNFCSSLKDGITKNYLFP